MDNAQALLDGRKPINETSFSRKTGLYGIFAKRQDCLTGVTLPKTGIVYVGMTEDSLDSRNHFLAKSSGFSSPRRSLGAILKRVLDLQAMPRARGPSSKNYDCYSFAGNGESRLSEWMRQNLDYAIVELDGDLRSVEAAAILALEPPLNLTGWRNPQKRYIMDLRKACKSEAKAAQQHQA